MAIDIRIRDSMVLGETGRVLSSLLTSVDQSLKYTSEILLFAVSVRLGFIVFTILMYLEMN